MNRFQQRLDRFPPVICRLLAKHQWGPPLTSREVADRSGLSLYRVDAISTLTSWNEVTVGDMRAFLTGCGLDFQDSKAMNRVHCYLRSRSKNKFVHLRRSPDRDYFAGLAEIAMKFIAEHWK